MKMYGIMLGNLLRVFRKSIFYALITCWNLHSYSQRLLISGERHFIKGNLERMDLFGKYFMRHNFFCYLLLFAVSFKVLKAQQTKCIYHTDKIAHLQLLATTILPNEIDLFFYKDTCLHSAPNETYQYTDFTFLKVDTSGNTLLEKYFEYAIAPPIEFVDYFYSDNTHNFFLNKYSDREKNILPALVYWKLDSHGKTIFKEQYPGLEILDYALQKKRLLFFSAKRGMTYEENIRSRDLYLGFLDKKGHIISLKKSREKAIVSSSFRNNLVLKKMQNSYLVFLNNMSWDSTGCFDSVQYKFYNRQIDRIDHSNNYIAEKQKLNCSTLDILGVMKIENNDSVAFVLRPNPDSLTTDLEFFPHIYEYGKSELEKRVGVNYDLRKKVVMDSVAIFPKIIGDKLYLFDKQYRYFLKYDFNLNLIEKKNTGFDGAYGFPFFYKDKVILIHHKHVRESHEQFIYYTEIKL